MNSKGDGKSVTVLDYNQDADQQRKLVDKVIVNVVGALIFISSFVVSIYCLFIGPFVLRYKPFFSLSWIVTISIYLWSFLVVWGPWGQELYDKNAKSRHTSNVKSFQDMNMNADRIKRILGDSPALIGKIMGRWERFCSLSVWRCYQRVHQLEVIQELDPKYESLEQQRVEGLGLVQEIDSQSIGNSHLLFKGNTIVGMHPHGGLPLGCCLLSPDAKRLFPNARTFSAGIATLVFAVPFLGLIMRWVGCISVSRSVLEDKLQSSTGNVIAIHPGGSREAYSLRKRRNVKTSQAIVSAREGIFSLATNPDNNVQSIIPCYCFGNELVASSFIVPPPWVQDMLRKLRMIFIWSVGKCGTPVPLDEKMLVVMGRPISTRDKNGQVRTYSQVQEEYGNEMKRIFKKWNAVYHKTSQPDLLVLEECSEVVVDQSSSL